MRSRLFARLRVLGAAALLLAVLAATPQPSRRAVPAKPVNGATALSGRVIFVDAGHGGTDGGARAKDSGVWEKEVNLRVSLALRDALEAMGATVVMSRTEDMQFNAKKRADLTARLEKATAGGAEMLLCVHMNEYRSRAESGPQVFYRAGQADSRLLAGALQQALIDGLSPSRKRQAMAGDYFMLSLDIPSVLIECGFLSNAKEEKLLLSPDYQQRVAQAIADGVAAYYALRGA